MTTVWVPLDQSTVEMAIKLQHHTGEAVARVIARTLATMLRKKSDPERQARTAGRQQVRFRRYSIALLGEVREVATLREVLITVLEQFHELDEAFLTRLSRKSGRKRRIVASVPEALYPGRSDLARYAHRLSSGWWVGTNYSRCDVERIVRVACAVAGLDFGTDVSIDEAGWKSRAKGGKGVSGNLDQLLDAPPPRVSRDCHAISRHQRNQCQIR